MLYGIACLGSYLLFYPLVSEKKVNSSCFSVKKIMALTLFHVLPFVQLETSFFGEFITALIIRPRFTQFELIFCAIYPLIMGLIQNIISWINDRYKLDLDLLAEAYSVLFASLPYKMLFLEVDAYYLAFLILCIKASYKTVAFIIIPSFKHAYFRKKKNFENIKKMKSKNLQKIVPENNDLAPPLPRNCLDTNTTTPQNDKSKSKLFNSKKSIIKRSRGARRGTVTQTFLTTIQNQFKEEDDKQYFALKFFFLQLSDLTSNAGLLNFTLIINFKNSLGFESSQFDSEFVQRLLIVNFVRIHFLYVFLTLTQAEMLLDASFIIFGFCLYKKIYFTKEHNISGGFRSFFMYYKWTMISAVWNLFFTCFSMWIYVVASTKVEE